MSYVKNIGGIVSGASSYVSSGLNYLGIKKEAAPNTNKYGGSSGGSSMMGFGSDSIGQTGGVYDPPGGYKPSGYDSKWGSQPTIEEKPKPVWG